MSIASRIQEIETHIGDVYDTINYSYDTTGVNKNIINIPKYLKKGYIDIINNGIDTLYNNFPKVSGIGSNLSLTPTYEAPMKLNEIQGDTLQDGTPTPDTPVEIQSVTGLQNIEVCGKNLCFNITKPSNANLRFFINKSISKTFTISFTTNEALNGNSLYLEVDGTSYGNIGGITASANTKVEKTYTLSDANYQAIQNGTNIDLLLYKNGANFNIPNDGMVENNSSSTTYEPYKGNTYEVNLGKNLLLFPYTESTLTRDGITYTINNDGSIKISGTATSQSYIDLYRNTNVNLLEKGNTYTYSISPENSNIRLQFYERYNNAWNDKGYGTNKITFTISDNSEGQMIRLLVVNGSTIDTTISPQIEKGTEATSYSPYFTPIELNKIGDYQDRIYKDNGKWYVEKQIGKVVLDGSEEWTQRNTGDGSTTITFQLRMNFGAYGENNEYCNKFTYEQSSSSGNEGIGLGSQLDAFYIQIKRSRLSSVDVTGFKSWLSSNNVEVLYVLATPTYTEITNTELIEDLETLYTAKSQEGTTNISITSEDLEMILNVSALKGEV